MRDTSHWLHGSTWHCQRFGQLCRCRGTASGSKDQADFGWTGTGAGSIDSEGKGSQFTECGELLPAVKRGDVPGLLQQMDALYVGLQRQPLFRFGVSPNKLMDYMMAAKPAIFAIEAGNYMVADAQCGISIPPEDTNAIAAAAKQLVAMPKEELEAMGQWRGGAYILEHHEYDGLSRQFLDVFRMPRKKYRDWILLTGQNSSEMLK